MPGLRNRRTKAAICNLASTPLCKVNPANYRLYYYSLGLVHLTSNEPVNRCKCLPPSCNSTTEPPRDRMHDTSRVTSRLGSYAMQRILNNFSSFSFFLFFPGSVRRDHRANTYGPYHFSLSLAPAENVDDLSTSPISSRQKLKLFIVHM